VPRGDDVKDRDVRFHEQWLGLAQPIEGLVFSVPVLADAQIASEVPPELSSLFEARLLDATDPPRLRGLEPFLRDFLGYDQPGMLVRREALPSEIAFYAPEGGQELRDRRDGPQIGGRWALASSSLRLA
jgi:hypothetical protein